MTYDATVAEAAAKPRAEEKSDKVDTAAFMATFRKRWQRADERDRENRTEGYEDLEFLAGNQWSEEDKALRKDRPVLRINRLPQFVESVTGEMRQMRPSIKGVPVDDRGDQETADLIAGMIRYIENRSDASEAVYPEAADSQVAAGIGHWQVTSEYASDSTFEQELKIESIEDGIAVRWDPDAKDKTRRDALFSIVPYDISRDAFEEKWPGKSPNSLESEDGLSLADWLTDDHIRVAVYWYKKPEKKRLALMPNGGIDDVTGDPEGEAQAQAAGARIEDRDGHCVYRAVVSSQDVLEGPTKWPGRHIPVVPVVGREIRIGRKIFRYGLVRFAKDPQRLFNFAESARAEMLASQPKAPWLVTDAQIEGYENEWNTANSDNLPYLRYHNDPEAAGPPQRIPPPQVGPSVPEMVRDAAENLHAVTGIYPASLGAKSNESSGRAILARQREGDTGTFVFSKNFGLAIKRTAEIIVDLIPSIYDTARTVRIVGDDGKVDKVQINRPAGLLELPEGGEEGGDEAVGRMLNDVTIGAYDIVFEMGPSYASKQAEARDGMTAMLQAAPDIAPLVLDLIAKAQDWPLSDKFAKRLRHLLPPAVLEAEAQENGEELPPPPPPPQPGPAEELEARKQSLEAAKIELEEIKIELERMKIDAELEKARIEAQTTQVEAHAQAVAKADAGGKIEKLGQAVDEIDQVLEKVVEALGEQAQQPAAEPAPKEPKDTSLVDAIHALREVIAAPTELVSDEAGNPISSRKVLPQPAQPQPLEVDPEALAALTSGVPAIPQEVPTS